MLHFNFSFARSSVEVSPLSTRIGTVNIIPFNSISVYRLLALSTLCTREIAAAPYCFGPRQTTPILSAPSATAAPITISALAAATESPVKLRSDSTIYRLPVQLSDGPSTTLLLSGEVTLTVPELAVTESLNTSDVYTLPATTLTRNQTSASTPPVGSTSTCWTHFKYSDLHCRTVDACGSLDCDCRS